MLCFLIGSSRSIDEKTGGGTDTKERGTGDNYDSGDDDSDDDDDAVIVR